MIGKRLFALLFIAVLTTATIGCSGESPAAKNDLRSANNGAVAGTASSPNNQASAPTNTEPSASQPKVPQMRSRDRRIDALRNAPADPNAPKPDVESTLQKSSRPAPENSQFAVSLTDILVERRTFLDHPRLAKVEKVTDGEKRAVRIFFKDGRTVELPGDAIQSLSTASSASILTAAGVTGAARPVSNK